VAHAQWVFTLPKMLRPPAQLRRDAGLLFLSQLGGLFPASSLELGGFLVGSMLNPAAWLISVLAILLAVVLLALAAVVKVRPRRERVFSASSSLSDPRILPVFVGSSASI
jgi:hypothetical protein